MSSKADYLKNPDNDNYKKVLKVLCENHNKFVSGEAISKQLELTRTSIWKHINDLVKEGYKIERKTKQGYKLKTIPDVILSYKLEESSDTTYIGKKFYYYKTVGSTNDIAQVLAKNDASSGTVVVAENQKMGKGRQGREWISPEGGLWVSVILRPDFAPEQASKITLITAISIAETIKDYLKLEVLIKWPNDIYIENKKLGGILTEMNAEIDKINYIVLGFGLNVNNNLPQTLKKIGITIKQITKKNTDRTELLKKILANLEKNLNIFEKVKYNYFINLYKKLNYLSGKKVRIRISDTEIIGICKNLDKDGNLIVKDIKGNLRKILSGDIEVIG